MKKNNLLETVGKDQKVLVNNAIEVSSNEIDCESFGMNLCFHEERLNLALKASGLGTFDWHVSDEDAIWDKRMHQIFGLKETSTENRNDYFFGSIHPDCSIKVEKQYASILSEKNKDNSFETEYKILRNGEVRYITAHGFLFRDKNGAFQRIIGTCNDITEQKKAEVALQKSEMQYRALVENSHDLIWELDQQGNFTFVNSAAKKIFGFEPEEMIGTHFTKHAAPASSEKTLQSFEEILSSGQSLSHYECKVLNKKGELVILDSHIVTHRNDASEIIGVTGSSQDITTRKKSEEEFQLASQKLKETTERLLLSTEAARVGIFDWDMKSDELIWDKTMKELYGIFDTDFSEDFKNWSSIVHPDDLEECMAEIDLMVTGTATVYDTTFRVIWPDKSIHHIKALGKVQRDENGEGIRMIGANWDVTKEKEAEVQKLRTQQLEVKNKELEKFAYVASHDLREPLRTMKSFAQLMEVKYIDKLDEKASKYLNFISKAASRMGDVVNVLLDHSRVGQNTVLASIDCQSIINDLMKDLDKLISETKVSFEIDPLPVIKAYEVEMRMIFQNLVSNAIKFRKEDTRPVISISAKKKSMHWEFCIADNGIGIEPQFKEKIFSLFQKLHSRVEYEGAGIGLAHCQKIVELHGGKIWVESEVGVGSSFYFTIPFFGE